MCSTNTFTRWLVLFFEHWHIAFFTLAFIIILVNFTFCPFACAFVSVFGIWDWLRNFEYNSKKTFIFNWNTDFKPCNFRLRTWSDAKALATFLIVFQVPNCLSIYPAMFLQSLYPELKASLLIQSLCIDSL